MSIIEKLVISSTELKCDPPATVTPENKQLKLIFLLQVINLESDSTSMEIGGGSLICLFRAHLATERLNSYLTLPTLSPCSLCQDSVSCHYLASH